MRIETEMLCISVPYESEIFIIVADTEEMRPRVIYIRFDFKGEGKRGDVIEHVRGLILRNAEFSVELHPAARDERTLV